MPKNTRQIIHFLFLLTALLSSASISLAQNISNAEIKKAFASAGRLNEDEFSGIKKGKFFARVLPVEDKRDLTVVGTIGIDASIEDSLKGFDWAISRQRKKTGRFFGNFESTPTAEDLRSLRLDKNDIKDLKECTVGGCKLGLSEEMIRRFRSEIDWEAKDHIVKANRLYREMLTDYVTDYLKRGNEALIEYKNEREPLSLKNENQTMHDNLLWLNEFAPEFSKYIKEFPNVELANVEDKLRWAVVKVVGKPVLIINHISTYTKTENGTTQILVISKQIYANHRFDASLGLTVLLNFPEEDPKFTYFLYTTTARVGALKGALGKLVRPAAEEQATDTLKIVLKDTKRYAKTPILAETDPALEEDQGILEWFYGSMFMLLGLIGATGIAVFAIFKTRRPGIR